MLKSTSRAVTIALATSALTLFGAGAALAEEGGDGGGAGGGGNNPACMAVAVASGVNQTFPIPGFSALPAPFAACGGEGGGGGSSAAG